MEIDDHVAPARRGRGRRPRLSDAELLTLAVAQVLPGIDDEHRWIRFAYCRLGHLFCYLPKQPGYHKRLKAAAPLLAAAITHLARVSPSWCDSLRLVDATPVPCGTSRETVGRSELAGHAGYGYCAAHSRFYWGLKLDLLELYLLAAPDGMPIAWCLADPKIGEREVCLDLLTLAVETGRLRPGSTVLADKGLASREIEGQIAALGVTMLHPDRRDERARHGNLGVFRQWIESVFDTLKGQLGLERHGGRTCQGGAPASLSACSPWPPRSGTTGPPGRPASAASPPTTTKRHLHGIRHLVYAGLLNTAEDYRLTIRDYQTIKDGGRLESCDSP